MKYTANLNLKKPEYTDQADIQDINDNMDAIDSAIASHIGSTGSAHGVATTSAAGFMSASDKQKLDIIEAGAQVNPTAAEIRDLLKTVDGSGSGVDADTLDGKHASSFVKTSDYEDADVLNKIKNVDGSGSGLDADLLDGWHRDSIRNWNNILNKPSTFTPSAHTHSKSDITDLPDSNVVKGIYTIPNVSCPGLQITTITIPIGVSNKKAGTLHINCSNEGYWVTVFFTDDVNECVILYGYNADTTYLEKGANKWVRPGSSAYGFLDSDSYSVMLGNIRIEGSNIVLEGNNSTSSSKTADQTVFWKVW